MVATAASTPKEINTLKGEKLNCLFTEKFQEFPSHDPAIAKLAWSTAKRKGEKVGSSRTRGKDAGMKTF